MGRSPHHDEANWVIDPRRMPAGRTYRRGMGVTLPILAGMASTAVFVVSVLPMLGKAVRTRELSSYSLGNIVLANIGNAVHSVYVFHLPPGPIWVLHVFYLISSALMLALYLRQHPGTAVAGSGRDATYPSTARKPEG